MKNLLIFLVILGVAAVLTCENLIALLISHPLFAAKVNVLCLYACGFIFCGTSVHNFMYVPWALKHPERPEFLIAFRIVTNAGGVRTVIRHGYWTAAFGAISFVAGIYLQKHIG